MTRSQTLALRMGVLSYATGLLTEQSKQGLQGDIRHITGEPVPVTTNFEFAVFANNAATQLVDTKIGDNDPRGPLISFGGSKTPGSLTTNGAHTDWYPVGSGVADGDLLLSLNEGAMFGTNRMLLSRLNDTLTLMDASAGTATIDSTDAAADVVNLIQVQIEAVEKACGGYCDVALLWGPVAYRKISNHTKVQNRITGAGTKQNPSTVQTVTTEQMDAILGYDTSSRRSRAVYNSARPGQTITNDYLLGSVIYVAAVSRTPNRIDPSAVKLFQGKNGDGNILTPIYYGDGSGTHEQAKWNWMEKTVVTNASAIKKITIT